MSTWRSRYRSLLSRIGHRGASLLFLALLDFSIAISLYPASPDVLRNPLYQEISKVAPIPLWAGLWFVVGAACLIYAFRSQDRVAFSLAAGIKTVWAVVYTVAWIEADIPRVWVGVMIWFAFAGWVLIISTWPEVHVLSALKVRHDDASVISDPEGRIIAWSDIAEDLFGWTDQEMIGVEISQIMPDRSESDPVGVAIRRRALHKDGHEFPVEVVLSSLETPLGVMRTAIIRPERTS